jgi:Ca2+-binding EF-hand superfamily protein
MAVMSQSTKSSASLASSATCPDIDLQASTNYKEAFSLFDKRGTGRVPADALGDLLRACGQNPTLAEISDLEKGVGKECKISPSFLFTCSGEANKTANTWMIVDFDTFSRVLNRPGGFREPGEPEEYCRGFQVFDKDMTGFIGVGQLRYILTNLGEKMSDDEVDELLKAVDTSSGEISYTGMYSCQGVENESCANDTIDLVRTILNN